MRFAKFLPKFVKKTRWYQNRFLNDLRLKWEEGFQLLLTAPDLDMKLHMINRLDKLDMIISSLEIEQGKKVDWDRLDRLVAETEVL